MEVTCDNMASVHAGLQQRKDGTAECVEAPPPAVQQICFLNAVDLATWFSRLPPYRDALTI